MRWRIGNRTNYSAFDLKKKSKDFLVHDKRLFPKLSTESGLYPTKEMRESILKGLHDEAGHWVFN